MTWAVAQRSYLPNGGEFSRMSREVLADFQIHAVQLCEETGYGGMVVARIGLHFAYPSHLGLEVSNPFKRRAKFLVVMNHARSPRQSREEFRRV